MAIDKVTLGKTIRELRESFDFSQVELAKRAGLSGNSMIAQIESGKKNASLDTLNKIAEAFKLPGGCLAILGSKVPKDKAAAELLVSTKQLVMRSIRSALALKKIEDDEKAKTKEKEAKARQTQAV